MSDLGVSALEDQVYTGTWINWSHGNVYGSTLTLTVRDGNLLVAFIALFVAFAAGSLYRIICFTSHLLWSSEQQRDAIHHQRQAILRNSESGLTATWAFAKMIWQWKRRGVGHRPLRRVLPVMALIIIITLALLVAGVYSSEISAMTGDEVLIRSTNCGIMQAPDSDNLTNHHSNMLVPYATYDNGRVQAFRNLVQDCYMEKDSRNCKKLFARPQLKANIIMDKAAPCPFNNTDYCHAFKKWDNMVVDSGFLDSHTDLGINAPPGKRARFRQVLKCAPFSPVIGRSIHIFRMSETDKIGTPYQLFHFGDTETGNDTYRYRLDGGVRQMIEGRSNHASYTLGIMSSESKAGSRSQFKPESGLYADNAHDADIMLAFLSHNGILYQGQVDDPWYSAHQRQPVKSRTGGGSPVFYTADLETSILGCQLQYQTCLPPLETNGKDRCSKLGNMDKGHDDIINKTEDETQMLHWIKRATLGRYTIPTVLERLGQDSLTSRYSLGDGVQNPLNKDQWQSDVQRWFDLSLASFQMSILDAVTGPSNPRLFSLQAKPQTPVEEYMCNNQKIRSTAHSNFSVFGLSIIFAVGSLLVIIHWSLDPLFKRWLWRFCRSKQYSSLEWNTNGVLQLQRLAYEGAGYGAWRCCDDGCPVTDKNIKLAPLDLSNPSHPTLRSKNGPSVSSSTNSLVQDEVSIGGVSNTTRIRLDGPGPHFLVVESRV